jgi:hypothetical protein
MRRREAELELSRYRPCSEEQSSLRRELHICSLVVVALKYKSGKEASLARESSN